MAMRRRLVSARFGPWPILRNGVQAGTIYRGALLGALIWARDPMLRLFASWAGRRVTGFVALVYFAGVVMPSVALAFADGSVSAYCFDEIAAQVAALHIQSHVQEHVHVHSDGTAHHHVDKTSNAAIQDESQQDQSGTGSRGHSHDGNCCGLFGFTAVLPALSNAIDEPAAYYIQQPILINCLVGCGPGRINRPPILSLPM
jgi:hypothetical protein